MSQHCLSCGACCASFRVSFYWAETDAHPLGSVPHLLTQSVSPHYVCMNGTEKNPVHCVALEGKVGEQVSCSIYASRSSTCREFSAGSEACNHARAIHHLPAIAVES
ncbi:MAG: zinc/iron-chelating domain-containing protein [Methylophilaceae bacterium 17-43-7]|nr:MAG: zinc/iron-chelating domain-containing protein [Methylophilaceae bacterium 17-43-7]